MRKIGDSDTLSDFLSEDEDSQSLILSLLNCRKEKNQESQEQKRQFIQEQLEIVHKQREELKAQQTQNSQLITNGVIGIRSARTIGINLHELSTIKEVDTPKSERNLKLNQNVTNNRISNVGIYLFHLVRSQFLFSFNANCLTHDFMKYIFFAR